MSRNLPLPFPVLNASDLKRAIRYVLRSDGSNMAARRYVSARARALGRIDLLPTSWTNMTVKTQQPNLDHQLKSLASAHELSETQLKTVYLRGVNEFLSSEITYGSASMYGLARVQRFITERGLHIDTDLTPSDDTLELSTNGIDLTLDTAAITFEVLYGQGEKIADIFKPGVVTSLCVSNEELDVAGILGDLKWTYSLDMVTGADSFTVQ